MILSYCVDQYWRVENGNKVPCVCSYHSIPQYLTDSIWTTLAVTMYLTISMAWYIISDWSIPITWLAPALAANMESMPVPHPTSKTTFITSKQSVIKWKWLQQLNNMRAINLINAAIENRYPFSKTANDIDWDKF